ncbi:MAG: AAA family ATPase [Chitinophagaceae bacterium]
MKLLIMGASGAGATTLGKALANQLGIAYFDTDEYFWLPSDPPFTTRRLPEERNALLLADLASAEHAIVGGSVINWGDNWRTIFDHVVFLYLPHDVRMQRLHAREVERYGTVIFDDAERNKQYRAFMEWAAGYDDNTARGRTLMAHEQWLQQLACPVIEIRGDLPIEEKKLIVLAEITPV